MMIRQSLLLLGLVTLSACGASLEQLQARAAFDLNCPQDKLQVTEIDDRTRGVRGCGQQVTYVESCQAIGGYGQKMGCTWVLNTDGKKVP
jgi:hypothetical protein